MCGSITDDDVGKRVENADGEVVGVVASVDEGIAHVRPKPGAVESIKSSLGWESRADDPLPLDPDAIRAVTDDAVRLEGDLLSDSEPDRESRTGDTTRDREPNIEVRPDQFEERTDAAVDPTDEHRRTDASIDPDDEHRRTDAEIERGREATTEDMDPAARVTEPESGPGRHPDTDAGRNGDERRRSDTGRRTADENRDHDPDADQ
ncbi:hypothetical protein [Halopiger djelfimassiliensis]|uniref:hypothetical protein n=1 Tax=Halopiger djelfimassiliensis TaxID=1293047 RepID=UPI0009DBA63B|nr:hypothetical protein [Halopiger djelfimassiliensis]